MITLKQLKDFANWRDLYYVDRRYMPPMTEGEVEEFFIDMAKYYQNND